ncbi:unnamed protein product [Spodoptera littoralis]|uniref:Brinker DNA-binding domain-containing protein n=1 Tax=Spodoptera littoralis TaxID=7109 RepID=A0A9P0IEC2_SPOLI|nr:unnamed protein product [Spodoptera littoralis]CAH1643620.1 unnamed protein product [Spodoptera littoralis]
MYTRLTSHTHARWTGSGAPPTSAPCRGERAATVSPAPTTATRTRILQIMAAAHTHPAPAPSDRRSEGRAGSRRIFPPQFKLQVLEAYRRDAQCRGNQRATARKFGIHRRQIQKWLQAEPTLRAALLRRAPQPAPSPPPYAAGSPESARLPTPPPVTVATPVQVPTPLPVPVPVPVPMQISEPIDLSVRRPTPPPAPQPAYVPPTAPCPTRKPFKLFRPYLLEDEEEKRPSLASLPVSSGVHVSAFVPVQSAAGCALAACSAPRWCSPIPSFPAPLR